MNLKPVVVNQPIVIFDASCFLYTHGNNSNYERTLRDHIEGTLNTFNTPYYVGILDGKKNFRQDLATIAVYKGTRDKSNILEKFPHFYDVKNELIKKYKFQVVNGIEADDLVGILAQGCQDIKEVTIHTAKEEGENIEIFEEQFEATSFTFVVASIDKDLPQMQGLHYNLHTHKVVLSTNGTSFISLNTGRNKLIGSGFKFLYAQVLMGDVADNIKGLGKCGPVKAYELLQSCTTPEECKEVVLQAFVEYEIRLLRPDDYKTLNLKDFTPEEETSIQKDALQKYQENYNLVKLLEKNKYVKEIKIQKYNFN